LLYLKKEKKEEKKRKLAPAVLCEFVITPFQDY